MATVGLTLGSMIGTTSIDLKSFSSLIGLSAMYQRVIWYTNSLVRNIQDMLDVSNKYKISKEKTYEIMDVYFKEQKRQFRKPIKVDSIEINNYYYEYYSKDNGRDIRRSLKAPHIKIDTGETILLSGESGSGKSTFIKSLLGQTETDIAIDCITINQNVKYNKIPNAVLYDPEDSMGSRTLFEEITFNQVNEELSVADREKIERIISGLGLTDSIMSKISASSLTEATKCMYADRFSEGERRRLMLARLLHHMDDKVDVICLDEPTANLDRDTAKEVMRFVKAYCNEDRKRILIVASHDLETMTDDGMHDKWYHIDESNTINEFSAESGMVSG